LKAIVKILQKNKIRKIGLFRSFVNRLSII